MIFCLKDERGYPFAYIEWVTTEKDGTVTSYGEYLYIWDLWIHGDYDDIGDYIIRHFIKMLDVDECCINVKEIYWNRRKFNGRPLRRTISRKFAAKHGRYLTEENYIKENQVAKEV